MADAKVAADRSTSGASARSAWAMDSPARATLHWALRRTGSPNPSEIVVDKYRPAAQIHGHIPVFAAMPIQTRCACTRARRAARALTDLYDDALTPVGLRVTQFSVLRTVQRMGLVNLSALGTEMALDRSTLGRNLRLLEAMELVTLSHGDDLRTQTAALTRRGSERLRRALPLWERVQQSVRDRLGENDVDALFATLERVEALRPLRHARGRAN